nr:aldolase catalytic domain-containing protein [uncultured Celeribacter sp.]
MNKIFDAAGMVHLDCTLRDGGYYNAWDFSKELIEEYLQAMAAVGVDVVELGFRFLANNDFKGPCAFATDDFIRGLDVPERLTIGVMVNAADLLTDLGLGASLEKLFPNSASDSPVELVRIACHAHEFERILPAIDWLAQKGYRVGLNLMQISEQKFETINSIATAASAHSVEVLYFADSLGSMTPEDVVRIVGWFRTSWDGPLGIHTHDNMGLALSNTLTAIGRGISWIDSTVTGMGRGPGNARTEELAIELGDVRAPISGMKVLMALIGRHFAPMKRRHQWGSNPYYYLAGKYSIHPTYVQEMLSDPRYSDDDIVAVIEHLRRLGGQKYNAAVLEEARTFYAGPAKGEWNPKQKLENREVLLLGTGPGAERYRDALEDYVRRAGPVVIALNTQTAIAPEMIDLRIACHPVRLLADSHHHLCLPQPLVTPASMLPKPIREALAQKELLDFGLVVEPGVFFFGEFHCVTPNSLVLSYALALCAAGNATRVLMAGFDGYPPGDARNDETADILLKFNANSDLPLLAVTPTCHRLASASIYAL